eukprot:Lankesteria_metandrocarpae@DN10484_c0_g1_i1.p1
MGRITQPTGQIRLTNVAVVKLRQDGKRFEVACYRNKVLNFRSGVETDIDEVLQTNSVFQNVSKGQFARKEDIVKVFGHNDTEKVCRHILTKGTLQVADKERGQATDALLRDVCTIVAQRTVNPRTSLPLTIATVESALKSLGFGVRWEEKPKKEALRAIDLLVLHLPDQVARSQMLLRVDSHAAHCEQQVPLLVEFLSSKCKATVATTETSNVVNGSGATTTSSSVQFSCAPSHYREIDEYVSCTMKPAAVLHVISNYYCLKQQVTAVSCSQQQPSIGGGTTHQDPTLSSVHTHHPSPIDTATTEADACSDDSGSSGSSSSSSSSNTVVNDRDIWADDLKGRHQRRGQCRDKNARRVDKTVPLQNTTDINNNNNNNNTGHINTEYCSTLVNENNT